MTGPAYDTQRSRGINAEAWDLRHFPTVTQPSKHARGKGNLVHIDGLSTTVEKPVDTPPLGRLQPALPGEQERANGRPTWGTFGLASDGRLLIRDDDTKGAE